MSPCFAEITGESLVATLSWSRQSPWSLFSKFKSVYLKFGQQNRNLILFWYKKRDFLTKIQVSKRERIARATLLVDFIELTIEPRLLACGNFQYVFVCQLENFSWHFSQNSDKIYWESAAFQKSSTPG